MLYWYSKETFILRHKKNVNETLFMRRMEYFSLLTKYVFTVSFIEKDHYHIVGVQMDTLIY